MSNSSTSASFAPRGHTFVYEKRRTEQKQKMKKKSKIKLNSLFSFDSN